MISGIIDHSGCDFAHFAAGRKDGERFDVNWLIKQTTLPIRFAREIKRVNPDVIHINTAFEPAAIIRDYVLSRVAGKARPVVVHVHGGRFVLQDFPRSGIASFADRLLASASRVIALSQVEADALTKFVPASRLTVLSNAVAADRFSSGVREWGVKNILYLGRLHESKGLDDIVESCRLLLSQGFKFRFNCFGTGPDQERFLTAMIDLLGENFHYGGVVSGDEKVRALTKGDIFLMPSKFEGLPLSLLEAMAAGCIPVVSSRGAIPSVVEDGHNGFLVEPGDLTQIVGKLKFLLSEGEPGWNKLRENARRTIVESFDLGRYAKKLEALYSEVLSDNLTGSRVHK
ncbi:MAG TPA: glycosyltransferase family 4 protein [Pyrinomonadaceae bacterium]